MVNDGVSKEVIDRFTRVSPIAWIHMQLTGRYSFKKNKGNIDIKAMAKMLEKFLKQSLEK